MPLKAKVKMPEWQEKYAHILSQSTLLDKKKKKKKQKRSTVWVSSHFISINQLSLSVMCQAGSMYFRARRSVTAIELWCSVKATIGST